MGYSSYSTVSTVIHYITNEQVRCTLHVVFKMYGAQKSFFNRLV